MPELLTANPALPNLMAAPPAKAAVAASPAAERANPAPKAASENGASAPADSPASSPPGNGSPPSFAAVLRKQMAPANTEGSAPAVAPVDPALLTAATGDAPSAENFAELLPFIERMVPLLMANGEKDDSTQEKDTQSSTGDLTSVLLPSMSGPGPAAIATVSNRLSEQSAGADTAADGAGLNPLTNAEEPIDPAISADLASRPVGSGAADESDFSALVQRAGEQLASAQNNSHGAQRTGATDAPLRMETPVGHKDWSSELGNKLTWMATAQRQQADLVLNPPQLGRVEVSLTVSGDQASAVFASPNAAVRELIEDSLPRLKEILSGAGINLGEAQVGSESSSRFGNPSENAGTNRAALGDGPPGLVAPNPVAAAHRSVRAGQGMVDIFA